MPLIEAFIKTRNFDIICFPKTLSDSRIDISDTRININGYSILIACHPSNTKCSGACIYYKNYLPVFKRTDLSDLQECIVAETVDEERCFLICLYRSSSQNDDEFETFCILNNINKFQPPCSVLLGDFNAKKFEMVFH